MTDHPLLFSAPMVRALIEGRKTQTRRVLKPKAVASLACAHRIENVGGHPLAREYDRSWPIITGYAPGDRLWVREKWQGLSHGDYLPTKSKVCDLRYGATDPLGESDKDVRGYPWRPSIHMPRWASRLTLLVTEVRVERLQDCSEADALAEGITFAPDITDGHNHWCSIGGGEYITGWDAREVYRGIWDHINGPGAWATNPWVVAVSFTVHQRNIDQLVAP